MLDKIKNFFKSITQDHTRKMEEEYLAKSVDLADLERRQRKLMNKNLRGWV